jgi:hypothetical protein
MNWLSTWITSGTHLSRFLPDMLYRGEIAKGPAWLLTAANMLYTISVFLVQAKMLQSTVQSVHYLRCRMVYRMSQVL